MSEDLNKIAKAAFERINGMIMPFEEALPWVIAAMNDARSDLQAEVERQAHEINHLRFVRAGLVQSFESMKAERDQLKSWQVVAQEVVDCAKVYFDGYCQDEADDPDVCGTAQQHIDAMNLKHALEFFAEQSQPAPLGGSES